MTAAVPTAVHACDASQSSSDHWGIMRRVLGSEKPQFLYIQSGPFSLSCVSLSLSRSFNCLLGPYPEPGTLLGCTTVVSKKAAVTPLMAPAV